MFSSRCHRKSDKGRKKQRKRLIDIEIMYTRAECYDTPLYTPKFNGSQVILIRDAILISKRQDRKSTRSTETYLYDIRAHFLAMERAV